MGDKIVICDFKKNVYERTFQMLSKSTECNLKYNFTSLIFDHLALLEAYENVLPKYPNTGIWLN